MVFVWPWVNLSLFRYKLWALRDDIIDDVLADRLPWNGYTKAGVGLVEITIRAAPGLTPLRWRLMPRPSETTAEAMAADIQAQLQQLAEPQRDRITKYMLRYASLISERVWLPGPHRRKRASVAPEQPFAAQEIVVRMFSTNRDEPKSEHRRRPMHAYQG
jgi:hypothetical protein